MKKIDFITTHDTSNYGSALQTFATQMLINSHGYKSELIDYIRETQRGGNKLKSLSESNSPVKSALKSVALAPTLLRWKKTLRGFLEANVSMTERTYYSEKELEEHPPEADIYCTGSDQVWNCDWNSGLVEAYYLKFVPQGKRKISLAASIGRGDFADWEKPQVYELLSQYDSISVRESSAVKILQDLGISNVAHVVDPTLLISADIWSDFSSERKIKEDYVLIYQLKRNSQFDAYAVDFAKRKGLKLVRMCTRFDRVLLPGESIVVPSISDFVSAFKYASYIITDSFHGTSFGLNLNREVICIYPQRFSSRIDDILKDTGMLHRHLTSYDDLDIADDRTDFTQVNAFLSTARNDAQEYLKHALRPF